MLRSADVFVYGKHLVNDFFVESLILVFGIGITQIVPTAAHKRVESVCDTNVSRVSASLFASLPHFGQTQFINPSCLPSGDCPSGVKFTS